MDCCCCPFQCHNGADDYPVTHYDKVLNVYPVEIYSLYPYLKCKGQLGNTTLSFLRRSGSAKHILSRQCSVAEEELSAKKRKAITSEY
jgi:hypothetical protein